ncbi:MAG: DNA primase [Bacteroidia bacterium]|nr:DNA primase [Bacteroidia bacterium]
MIDQATKDRILTAAKIEEVVGDFVTLKKRGVNLIGLCPFHNEKTPSFTVSPAKNICKCFGCSKGGSPVNFIMLHEQLDYADALRYLARKYNIEIVEKELSSEELEHRNDRESMFAINQFALNYFTKILWENEDGRAIGISYFKERGFRDNIIKKFQLGFCLDKFDSLSKEAIKSGYNKQFLLKTGLCTESERGGLVDRFRGRVMFPVHSLSGKIVAFGGRVLKKTDNTAKYVNSPDSEIYHKSNELYGIFFAKNNIVKEDRCFLVEGYTDVISMHQAGIENVVASSGTSLTPGQIRLIHRFTSNITVLYDGDAAGIHASIRGIDMLLSEGMNVKVVLLPDGEDPDSFARSKDSSEFNAFIQAHQTDFIRFKTQLLLDDAAGDPIKKANLINDIVTSISVIPDAIIRSLYIKECADRFEMRESVLAEVLAKKISGTQKTISQNEIKQAVIEKDQEKPFAFMQEQNLIRYIIRYGKNLIPVQIDENKIEQISVLDYINQSLIADDMQLEYGLHKYILQEAIMTEGDFRYYFLNHPDESVRNYAFYLSEDKYERSNIHDKFNKTETEEERLKVIIPRITLEYKNKILEQQSNELIAELKQANAENDYKKINELINKQMELNKYRQTLARYLGERTIIAL